MSIMNHSFMNEINRTRLDLEKLALLIRNKRGNRNLRDIAAEIGDVSPSTLSRVENGKTPDMDTFLCLCDWLGVKPEEFFVRPAEAPLAGEPPTRDQITLQLRADRTLEPAASDMLAAVIKAAYDQFGRKPGEEGA